jgi:hypothetical protein
MPRSRTSSRSCGVSGFSDRGAGEADIKVQFRIKEFNFLAELNNTLTARQLVQKLPIESTVSRWGDELYFEVGCEFPAENPTHDVNIGDIAFWAEGKCLCVFFGRTPASVVDKPVPEKPVVIVGKTLAAAEELRQVRQGERIMVSLIEETTPPAPAKEFFVERKLSQAEIDVLVRKLLAEKEQAGK